MKNPLRILCLEDDLDYFLLIQRALRMAGLECLLNNVQTEEAFRAALGNGDIDLILADYSLPTFDGLSALALARERLPDVPFIILSGSLGEELGINALREGAADYLLKSGLSRLAPAIQRALGDAEMKRQRRASEAKIREQARMLDLAQDAILVRDLEDRVEYCNRGAERLYGYNASEMLGRGTTEVFDRADSHFAEAKARLLEQGEWSGEMHQLNRDGLEVITASRWTLVRDEKGQPKSILSIATDITSRRQLELQVRQVQKLEAIGQLAGGIAHDFNNILAAILAFTTMAQDSVPERPDVQADLSEVTKAALRARDLVHQILTFSRRQEQVRQPVRIQPIIKETVRLLRSTLPAAIEIRSRVDESAAKVHADPTQLYQLIMNLATNAKRAIGDKAGVLTITLDPAQLTEEMSREHLGVSPGAHVLLTVSDTGRGMLPEKLDRIFDPFFTTKEPGGGAGLGLSVVHGIVAGHGGVIKVDSQVDVGTTFHVWLPALPETETVTMASVYPGLPMGAGQRILLVDDEEANCLAARRLLSRIGYHPIDFTSPIEALAAFRAAPGDFDLVLADQSMPKMSGTELAREIFEVRPSIPYVVTTGQDDDALQEQAQEVGVEHILPKPYTIQTLAQVLKRLLPS